MKLDNIPPEPANYSPISANSAIIEIWQNLKDYAGSTDYLVAKLAEACYVLNKLATLAGCPGNMSVDTFEFERVRQDAVAGTETQDWKPGTTT